MTLTGKLLLVLVVVAIPLMPRIVLAQTVNKIPTHHGRVRVYFIAAEEVQWNYAPTGRNDAMGRPFNEFEKAYMESGAHRIGRIYKKVIYKEYTDATFAIPAIRKPDQQYLGLVGPILRGEVGDTLKIFFRNKASRPYSMHVHGLLYAKDSEGADYNDNSTEQDRTGNAVPPGQTHIYIWQIPERAGPGPNDPSSVMWLYHSHVDELRDIASGLFGAVIVTARGKAKLDGSPIDVDREFVTIMIIINENESWYLDENIRLYTKDPNGVNKIETEPLRPDGFVASGLGTGFRDVNLRYTINGYMFGSMPLMTMKVGEHVRWYVATLGDLNNFHTPHWHGNVVDQDGHRTDVIFISPAQVETVDMVPDNPGIWLYHCHVSDHMAAGMMTRYEVKP